MAVETAYCTRRDCGHSVQSHATGLCSWGGCLCSGYTDVSPKAATLDNLLHQAFEAGENYAEYHQVSFEQWRAGLVA